MINTIVKVWRGIAKLRGATDGTLIGNVSDAMKVSANITNTSVTTIETEHQRIHNGTSFTFCEQYTLQSGGTRGYSFEVGAKTLHFYSNVSMDQQTQIKFYEAPTGGTTSTTFLFNNRNRTSANTCSTTLKLYSVLPTSAGTELMNHVVGDSGGGNAFVLLNRSYEWILKTNTTYYFLVTSNGNGNDITTFFEGYETS